MTQTQKEEAAIEQAFAFGEISLEQYRKLMNDIAPYLWQELYPSQHDLNGVFI